MPYAPCQATPCQAHASCNVTGPTTRACTCNQGYYEITSLGTDLCNSNTCLINNGGCGSRSDCWTHGNGSTYCMCTDLHLLSPTLDGRDCVPIACEANASRCGPNSTCVEGFGPPPPYSCMCNAGYRSVTPGETCYQHGP